jgi:shikimate dehydrogenase
MRNIVLIGLSGSGKSTLGAAAAKRFGLDFFDTDAETEKREGKTIEEIFSECGEPRFRELEAATVRAAARRVRSVVATGGGAVLREENMRALRENGLVVFLDRPPERIARELDPGARPLLSGGADRILELSRERRALYLAHADVCLPCAAGPQDALERLCNLVRGEYPDTEFAVIGDPIGHSLSPAIHNAVFDALKVDMRYGAIHVPRGTADAFVARARAAGLRGFNVTIPHKRDIVRCLDALDEDARLCGAVNTVRAENGRFVGYNTDSEGLLRALKRRGRAYGGSRVAILGAGGAAAGIAMKAARENARAIAICARRADRADALRRETLQALAALAGEGAAAGRTGALEITAAGMDPPSVRAAAANADILIDATPLGMAGAADDHASLAFLEALPAHALVCDLVYNPPRTKLLREAEARGLETLNGLDMLVAQALLADEIFLGRALDIAALSEIAIKAAGSAQAEFDNR